jgi:uncharacterized protein
MLNNLARRTISLLEEIDRATTVFQAATGLQCPAGCGECCQNPEVETTPLEMLPIAWELYQRGELDRWIQQVGAINGIGVCVFYRSDPVIPGNGRCSIYPWRPSLCRLFGFAAVVNKHGNPELAACKKHKEVMPEVVAESQAAIANGLPVPQFADFAMRFRSLDPNLGQERLPINQALKVAIERVGLLVQLEKDNDI